MGRRGPPRTPTVELQLTGSSSLRRAGRNPDLEPAPEIGHPAKPEWLGVVAGEEWDVVVGALVNSGTLAVCESRILAMYCLAIEEYLALDKVIRSQPSITGDLRTLSARSRARADMLRHAQELGLTPAARSRVIATKKPETGTGKGRHFAAS